MGIQGLMQNLAPYGRRRRWTAQTEAQYPYVIIDGPAFAYFIYARVAARQRSEAGLPLLMIPTYQDVASEAVQYLQALEKLGFKIRKVFFDGFLPPNKRNIRLGRLSNALYIQDRFRKAFPSVIGKYETQSSDQELSGAPNIAFPKLPFLINAVLEALLESELGLLIATVHVEADTICARTSTSKDLILTNDTDLIVLQPRGKIAFLGDCHLVVNEDQQQDGSSFECTIFDTRELCQSLNCPDLVQAAFWLSEDPHKTLSKCSQRVREGVLTSLDAPRFNAFKESYSLDLVFSDFPDCFDSALLDSCLKPLLRTLDGRVAELVYSALSTSLGRRETIDVTLPPSIDDTTRASACLPSRNIRKLSYALLNRCSGVRQWFNEVYRKGPNNLAHVHVDDKMTSQQLQQELDALRRDMKVDQADIVEESHYLWRFICLRYTIKALSVNLESLPPIELMERLICKDVGDLCWEHAHISATAEGVLYSLRMLRQIGQVYLVLVDTDTVQDEKDVVTAVRSLVGMLEQMPPLSRVLIRSSWFLPLGQYQTAFLHSLEREFGLVRHSGASSLNSKPKRGRDKGGKDSGNLSKGSKANASRNLFSALATE